MAINQDIKGLVVAKQYDANFVFHYVTWSGDHILSRCMKAGTTVESLEMRWLRSYDFRFPRLDEQTAIAEVLSDMDAEIEALEARLAKARLIKQGMMQELLTGRIRLV